MNGTTPQPEDQIGYLLVRLAHTLSQRWSRDLAAHGLSARQHGVLAVLVDQPGMSSGAVARAAMITPQSMGELLSGLEDRGLVRREPAAGRGYPARVEVTDEGRRLLAEVEPIVTAHNDPGVLGLSADQARRLRALLRQVLETVG